MSKFLRTIQEIDGKNKEIILQIEGCHNCPLVKFHSLIQLSTCRTFGSIQGNVVDDLLSEKIDSPKWCQLTDDVEMLDDKTYHIYNDKLIITNEISNKKLQIYNINTISKTPILNVVDLINKSETCDYSHDSNLAYEHAYTEYEEDNFTLEYSKPIKKYNICSLCGEEDKSVNRNVNHGICDDCWGVSYNNEERKKQSFINNFRMKRGESFEMKTFNLSILKSKNLKVTIKT